MVRLTFEPVAADETLKGLQVLRAIAALLVVFSHVLRLQHEGWAGNPTMYVPALPFGEFGVDAFFVISGFIMYRTAGREFGLPGASRRFLARRFCRIAPTYWLFTGLILLCPFAFGWRPASAAGLAQSLAFLPDYTNGPSFRPVLSVGWTLCFEMLFYLVFAACLALPRRIGLRVLIWAFPLYLEAAMLLGRTSLAAQPWWDGAMFWARPQLLLFVCGVVLAMAQEQFGRVADRRGIGLWLSLGALVLGPTAMLIFGTGPQAGIEVAMSALAVTLCVMGSGSVWRGLTPLVRLGDASYSLYLSHGFVIGALSAAWLATVGPSAPTLFAAVALSASCVVAWLVHIGVETPLTRLCQRLLTRPSPSAAALAVQA